MELLFIIFLDILGLIAGVHALIVKKDPRAAFGWLLVCLFLPGVGVILYLMFGLNRITVLGKRWQTRGLWHEKNQKVHFKADHHRNPEKNLFEQHTFEAVQSAGDKVSPMPMLGHSSLEPLFDGDQAYPQMLAAITESKSHVYMSSYIFGTTGVAHDFIEALAQAQKRGVDVRVIVDGVGALYTHPSACKKLKKLGVRAALFLNPLGHIYHLIHLNIRNHRKLLVIDGALAFTGGMNIHEDNVSGPKGLKVHDLHFKVQGPVVGELQDTFLKMWYFVTKDKAPAKVMYDDRPKGKMMARVFADGPYQNYPMLQSLLCVAIGSAKSHVRLMTPYFLPGRAVTMAVNAAALRGVKVEVLMPKANNLSFVKGATEANLPFMLHYGVQFFYSKGTFRHSKLTIIDDFCVFLGSANLDIRSLHLNFELNMQVCDHGLTKQLITYFDDICKKSREVTKASLQSLSFFVKLRNAFFKLFSLYM
jgi:cardiolipin synthase